MAQLLIHFRWAVDGGAKGLHGEVGLVQKAYLLGCCTKEQIDPECCIP
jgi:hypothetical protein